jgi:endonuclease-3 related protein
MEHREDLLKIYRLLNGYFGDLHWWPAESAFEVMVGAILTQNTAWTNVEKAINAF